jgi:hypothetical protein
MVNTVYEIINKLSVAYSRFLNVFLEMVISNIFFILLD